MYHEDTGQYTMSLIIIHHTGALAGHADVAPPVYTAANYWPLENHRLLEPVCRDTIREGQELEKPPYQSVPPMHATCSMQPQSTKQFRTRHPCVIQYLNSLTTLYNNLNFLIGGGQLLMHSYIPNIRKLSYILLPQMRRHPNHIR